MVVSAISVLESPPIYQVSGALTVSSRRLLLARDGAGSAVVLKAAGTGSDGQRAFTAEARALSACRHPGVVRLRDLHATPAGRPLLVLDALAGGSLDRQPRLDRHQRRELGRVLHATLDHLASRGIAHRRIAPEHILLTPTGPVLCGFSGALVDLPAGHAALVQDRRDLDSCLDGWCRPRHGTRRAMHWLAGGIITGLLATVAVLPSGKQPGIVLGGNGSGNLRLATLPHGLMELCGDGGTRLRADDAGTWSRQLRVRADASGTLTVQVDDPDGHWRLRCLVAR